jgi:ABC-type Zn uptake system ZnuABC Zn-binding protein ZnuA
LRPFYTLPAISFILTMLLAACAAPANPNQGLNVVVSTTLIGDAAARVGGKHIRLTVLLPVGVDPHTYEPRPQDIAALSDARLVLINGLGLEEALKPALEANVKGKLVEVSTGIAVIPFNGGVGGDAHPAGDPHTWMDPNNVIVWVTNIAVALAEVDPINASDYQSNAKAYITELTDLDAWIRQQVAQVPVERRKLVSDHAIFGYFAHEYGFEQSGTVVASVSTSAAPTAKELAALEDQIRQQGVPAIFVDSTANPSLSQQVAQDTGVKLVTIYTGSLGKPGGEADTYLKFMRYNVQVMVSALKD